MADAILVINAGSSSIKFSLFVEARSRSRAGGSRDRRAAFTPSRASQPRTPRAKAAAEKRWDAGTQLGHDGALAHHRRVVEDELWRTTPCGGRRTPRRAWRDGLLHARKARTCGDGGAREAGAACAAAPAAQSHADPHSLPEASRSAAGCLLRYGISPRPIPPSRRCSRCRRSSRKRACAVMASTVFPMSTSLPCCPRSTSARRKAKRLSSISGTARACARCRTA